MTFWYSTKEYKPSDSCEYLVYQETTGFKLFCYCDHFNDDTFKFMDSDTDEYLDGVTHFAHIPPIPLPMHEVIPSSLPPMQEVYILDLDLPERAKRCLIAENINTLKDLSQYTISQLSVIPNLGRLTLKSIKEELKKYHIRLNER